MYGGQGGAAIEGIVADTDYAVWNGDGGEAVAAIESTSINACYAVRNGDGSQASTTIEGTFSDVSHTIWYNYIIQTFTISESIFPYRY